jgi:hypothetical protein
LKNLDWTWDDNLLRSRRARRPGRYEFLQKHYYEDLILIGNVYPSCDKFFYPFLDMIGIETSGAMFYCPDEEYAYWRLYASRKPVSWLDVSISRGALDRSDDVTRTGFERCLAWGVYPGTADFTAERLEEIEKVRPFYRQYMPWILEVARAGWTPIPHARCSPPGVNVERFGHLNRTGRVYFTAHNASEKALPGMALVLEAAPLGLPASPEGVLVEDLKSGRPLAVSSREGAWRVALAEVKPETTAVVRIATGAARARLYLERLRDRLEHVRQTLEWLVAAPASDRAAYLTDEARRDRAARARELLERSAVQPLLGAVKQAMAGGAPLDRAAVEKGLQALIGDLRKLPADGHRAAMLGEARAALRDLPRTLRPAAASTPPHRKASGAYHAARVSSTPGFRALLYQLRLDDHGLAVAVPSREPGAPALRGEWSLSEGEVRIRLGPNSYTGFIDDQLLCFACPAGPDAGLWVAVRRAPRADPGAFAPWSWGTDCYNVAGARGTGPGRGGLRPLLGEFRTSWSNAAMKFVSSLNLFSGSPGEYTAEWEGIPGYPEVGETGEARLAVAAPLGQGSGRPDLQGAVAPGGRVFFALGELRWPEGKDSFFLLGLRRPGSSRGIPEARYALVSAGGWPAGAILETAPSRWAVRAKDRIVASGQVSVPAGTRGVYSLQSRSRTVPLWAFTDPSERLVMLAEGPGGSTILSIGLRQP